MAILSKTSGISTTGPTLLTGAPYVASSAIYYVNSVTGSDTNAGTRREKPKATVFGAAGAISVCTTGESNLIFCEKVHRETVSSAYTWAKTGITLISDGSGSDAATFTSSVVGVMVNVTATDVRIENCYFAASTAATTSRITIAAAGVELRTCYFESGSNDAADTVLVNAVADATVKGCTFKVTSAPTGTAQIGLRVTGASTNFLMESCTFDGQSFGWTDSACKIDTATADRFRLRENTVQNYSFINVSISGVKGYLGDLTSDSTSGWSWTE